MPMNPRLLVPRATGFNPKSLPGLKIWLDAGKSSSLTMNGGDVSQVDDLSGNGFHASQGTGANQPTLSATGFNGKPTLEFDLTDSLVSSATIADYFLTPTTSPTFVAVMACYMPAPASSGAIVFGSDAQANGRLFFASHFGGSSIIYDTVNPTTGRVILSGQTAAGWTTPHILTVYRIGAVMSVRRNGVEIAGRTNASGNYSSTTAQLQIGKCDGGGPNVMYLSEMLVYGAALSETQITAAESGLARKWGITLAPQVSNADAQDWVRRVYAAGSTVSQPVADAVSSFVDGCQSDGIWDAMKSVVLLCGADTLAGALVPLKGTAPTNNNFAEADYNRETGLVGDGSTTYLDSNRANDDDPQDDKHIALYASDPGSDSGAVRGWIYAGNNGTVGSSGIGYRDSDGVSLFQVNNQNAAFPTLSSPSGLVGATRSSSSEFVYRVNGVNATASETSSTPDSGDLVLYQRASSNFTTARLAFYSIGESLDLAALDTRVSALITAIGAAI